MPSDGYPPISVIISPAATACASVSLAALRNQFTTGMRLKPNTIRE